MKRTWTHSCRCREARVEVTIDDEGTDDTGLERAKLAAIAEHGWVRSVHGFINCSERCAWIAVEQDKLRVKSFETGFYDHEADAKLVAEAEERFPR